MSRVFNFSAGPAALPEAVLRQAADEMLDWHGAGCSVMEMSHRSEAFSGIIESAEAGFRALLGVPEGYRVLFLQGGGTQQFGQVPMNLLRGGSADYVVTGSWSKKAWAEARRIAPALGGSARLAGSTEESGFKRLPRADELSLVSDASYVHICTNETIHGVEVQHATQLPDTEAPLVADMSSHILSRPVDVARFGMIYAGAQKNIGPSGLVIVAIREDLLGHAWAGTPAVMDYRTMAENGSMLNTPATYSIYIAGLVFKWVLAQGGVAAMERASIEKSSLRYDFIDMCDFYDNDVDPACRSRMNVPFRLRDSSLDRRFLDGALNAGLSQLKGHKSFGGCVRRSTMRCRSTESGRWRHTCGNLPNAMVEGALGVQV